MISLLLTLAFVIGGIYFLSKKFNVSDVDISFMFAGYFLFNAATDASKLVLQLANRDIDPTLSLGTVFSLAIDLLFGYLMLRKAKVL